MQQVITEATEQQFQIKHEVRQLEMERLQKQLSQLQEQLQRREEQKQEIIKRRVAQLTDQDDGLRWDPLMPSGTDAYAPAGSLFAPGMPGSWVPAGSGMGLLPYGTNLPTPPAADPAALSDPLLPARVASPPDTRPIPDPDNQPASFTGNRDPNTNRVPSVDEAEARLAIAERELENVKSQYDVGLVHRSEFDRAEGAVRLGKILLEQAREEQELQLHVLEVDARKAEAELDAVNAELEAITAQLAEKQDDPGLAAQVRRAAAVVAQKQLDVERVRVMLERQLKRGTIRTRPRRKAGSLSALFLPASETG